VQQGADVNVRNRYGETPLYYAAAVGEKEAAQVLLELGADPDVKNNFIWADTPVDLAYRRGNSEVGNLIEHWDDDNLPKQVYKLWEKISCTLL
jgi:ankyrin repeat protein